MQKTIHTSRMYETAQQSGSTAVPALSSTQRQLHKKRIRRQEIRYVVLIIVSAFWLLSGSVWLRQSQADYKKVPMWFAFATYLCVAGVFVSTIERFMCFTCQHNAVSNVDTILMAKLIQDPFILFVLVLGICILLVDLLDPSSNLCKVL